MFHSLYGDGVRTARAAKKLRKKNMVWIRTDAFICRWQKTDSINQCLMHALCQYQWAKQGRGAVVLPLRCLGSDLVGSRRPGAEGCIARAENFMAGRDPWGWSNQSGLPGGSGAGPGRMGKAGVVRKGWGVSRLFLSGSSPSSSSLKVSQVQPCFLNLESSFLAMGIPGHLH